MISNETLFHRNPTCGNLDIVSGHFPHVSQRRVIPRAPCDMHCAKGLALCLTLWLTRTLLGTPWVLDAAFGAWCLRSDVMPNSHTCLVHPPPPIHAWYSHGLRTGEKQPIGLGWLDDSMQLVGPTEEDKNYIVRRLRQRFGTVSHAFLSHVPPHTRQSAMCFTACPCLLGADLVAAIRCF